MTLKKCLTFVLCVLLLLSLVACKDKTEPERTQTIESLPPIETAVQKEYTPEEILSMYNTAVQRISDADSYHMSGSWNSTSVFDGIMSTVVNTMDLKYAKGDKGPVAYFDAVMNTDGRETPHTTYHEGEFYYFDAFNWKYYTKSNDYTDFYADEFLSLLGDVELKNLEHNDQLDGSVEISFDIPMGEYQSVAILGILGDFTNENIDNDILSVRLTIDKDGNLIYFYMSFNSQLALLDSTADQTVVVSMSVDGYNATEVQAPTDLSLYENNVTETSPDGEHNHVGILSPEDVD